MHAARAGGRCDSPLAHIIFFQAWKFFRQRHVGRKIIPVEGIRALWCLIKDDEFGHLVSLLETGELTTIAAGLVHNAWRADSFAAVAACARRFVIGLLPGQ